MFELSRIPVLDTERLRLRGFAERDLPALTVMNADAETVRYLGTGEPLDELGSWRQLTMVIGHWALKGYGFFAVEERASGAFVGRVGLFYPATWPELELGWTIARPHWGKGYATEAALATRDWGFSALGLKRIASFIRPENERSIRVAEKIGERPDGSVALFGKDALRYALERP
jgi:RimJ/RimL family protein N-acetyltransferase